MVHGERRGSSPNRLLAENLLEILMGLTVQLPSLAECDTCHVYLIRTEPCQLPGLPCESDPMGSTRGQTGHSDVSASRLGWSVHLSSPVVTPPSHFR